MSLSPGSTELLKSISGFVPGVGVRVIADNGSELSRFGDVGSAGSEEYRCAIKGAEIIASLGEVDSAAAALVSSMLALIKMHERLEDDMESMDRGSSAIQETLFQLTDTLPRLSSGADDHSIAMLGASACKVAASVEHVMFADCAPGKGSCSIVMDSASDSGDDNAAPESVVRGCQDSIVAEVLALEEGDAVVLRKVSDGARLGMPGSPEHLARRQVLGVPVTYHAGGRRVVLGALLLLDKVETAFSQADKQAAEKQWPMMGSEETQIAESFAAMIGAVLGARKTAELGKELSMAQAIQRQILPRRSLQLTGFDVAADYQACGAVGGDYFDYVPMADGRTMVAIADVSGHNLASGMMMVSARATLRSLASVCSSLAKFFDDFAASMYDDLTSTERFLTAAAVAMTPNERRVEYVSAGHTDLLVYRAASGEVESVAAEQTILGFLPEPSYASRYIDLDVGDCLLMFTDGITEAVDVNGEMFGEERLRALLVSAAPGRSSREIVGQIFSEVSDFHHDDVASDDVTAVVIKCTGEGGVR